MQDTRKLLVLGGVLVALGLAVYYYNTHKAVLPIVSTDQITSWNFEGLYADGGELEARARAEIQRLKGLIGKGEFTDYELMVSISQQYALLGEGKPAHEYLEKALRIDKHTVIAYNNLGDLMARLGANATARKAYERALALEDTQLVRHRTYITFLIEKYPEDKHSIDEAFNEAYVQFGDVSDLLALKADWLIATGYNDEAIDALRSLRELATSADDKARIDSHIQKLRTSP